MRLIDVPECAISQPAYGRIIFFTGDIIVRLVQQFHRAVKAPGAVHVGIDRRMIVQILAVIDRSPLDFADGFVDLFDSVLFFLVHVMGRGKVLEMSACVPQVGERVQVCRMPSWFVGEGYGSAYGKKKYEYGAMSCSFHGLLKGLSAG
jgi:hypothetical protein